MQNRQTALEAAKRCAEGFLNGTLDWYTTQEYRDMLEASKKKSTIPNHILKVYMDSLIEKNECCPVTLMPLTKETICLTKCGHAFSRLSAKHWIQDAHSCPVCREPVSEHDLQVYCP